MAAAARWRKRADALRAAVRDVAPPGHPPPGRSRSAAGGHRALFDRYVRELRKARDEAEQWKADIVAAARGRGASAREAEAHFRRENPVGTCAFGRVVAALRKGWLDCAAANAKLEEALRVAPEDFVLTWLLEGENEDLAELLSGLPFWPLGLSEEGAWV